MSAEAIIGIISVLLLCAVGAGVIVYLIAAVVEQARYEKDMVVERYRGRLTKKSIDDHHDALAAKVERERMRRQRPFFGGYDEEVDK